MPPKGRFKEGQEALPRRSVKEDCGRSQECLDSGATEAQTGTGVQKALRFMGPVRRTVVLILWLQAGLRQEETVPLAKARHRRHELEAQGAVVYWSERI